MDAPNESALTKTAKEYGKTWLSSKLKDKKKRSKSEYFATMLTSVKFLKFFKINLLNLDWLRKSLYNIYCLIICDIYGNKKEKRLKQI